MFVFLSPSRSRGLLSTIPVPSTEVTICRSAHLPLVSFNLRRRDFSSPKRERVLDSPGLADPLLLLGAPGVRRRRGRLLCRHSGGDRSKARKNSAKRQGVSCCRVRLSSLLPSLLSAPPPFDAPRRHAPPHCPRVRGTTHVANNVYKTSPFNSPATLWTTSPWTCAVLHALCWQHRQRPMRVLGVELLAQHFLVQRAQFTSTAMRQP